jgi:hypothetical protein
MDTPSTGSQMPSQEPERNKAATSSGRGVTIADLPVRLTVAEPAMAAEVDALFGPMGDHDGPFAVEIVFETAAPPRPARAADEVYQVISLWRDGDELVVDSGGPLRAHATANRVVVGGVVEDGPLGSALLRRVVHHVIAHILSLAGRLVAHGAAIGRSGRAVLLLGASGSGKSTSAYLASLAGWSLLSDDLVVVRRSASGIEAIGIHRAIAVPPDVADVTSADIEYDSRDRRRPEVTLDSRPHELVAVVLVEHGTGAGGVESASGLSVASAFIGSTPAAGNVGIAAEALHTASVLATMTCRRLLLPGSPAERQRFLAGLFEQIADAAGIEP